MAFTGRHDIAEILALGPLQHGLYSLNRLHHDHPRTGGPATEPESDGYAIAVLTDFHGPLDPERLHRALRTVLTRHPQLTASFWDQDLPHPVQLIPAAVEVPWRVVRMTPVEFDAHVEAERELPFDLAAGPPLRVTLARLGAEHHRLLCVFHHIVIDGWSVPVFWNDLAAAYSEDSPEPVRTHPAYREYIGWLRRQDGAASLAEWRRALSGFGEPTVVASGTRVHGEPHRAVLTMRSLQGPPLETLLNRVRTANLTVNTVAQAAWAVLLNRLTGREDVVFGVTVSGRPEEVPQIESAIGLFINTIPARVTLDRDEPLIDLCRRIQRDAARQRSHGYTGLSEIQRATGHGDLFDTLMIFHNTPKGAARDTLDLGGAVTMSPVSMDSYTHYPLTVVPFLLDDRLYVNVDHIDALLGGLDPGRLAERFLQTMQEIAAGAADPSRTHRDLDILLPEERAELALLADGPPAPNPRQQPGRGTDHGVHREFERAAARHPDRIAVRDRRGEVTYRELDRWSNTLARRLRSTGVSPEVRVAIALPRTREYLVALLAVLKAGGTLVPLDLTAPTDRNTTIAQLARAHLLIALPGEQDWWDGPRCAPGTPGCADAPGAAEPLPGGTHPEQAVHVVFTSGSTGEPKGVVATHRGLATLLHAHRTEIYGPVTAGTTTPLRVGHSWSFAFDAAWQPQLALLSGHTLELFDEEDQHDPARLVRGIRDRDVDMLDTSPSMFARLSEAGLIQDGRCPLRILALGGEEISRGTWDTLAGLRGTRVHNFYGPTEITVEAVNARVRAGEEPAIGAPAPGSRALVLGPDLRPVPLGTRGELYLGGLQVARCYESRPALTAERFVPDPETGERLYRTGDVVRRDKAGRLIFLGRADAQVKIRGYRVELAEVVTALEASADVAKAVVVPFANGQGRALAAYVVASRTLRETGRPLNPVALRDELAGRVPSYLIPARITVLDRIPLTLNGKADLRALPRPTGDHATGTAARPPRTPTEHAVHRAVQALLDASELDCDDDLFHHGLDSITTISLVGELRRAGLSCTPRQVMTHRTIAELARVIDDTQTATARPEQLAATDTGNDAVQEVTTPVLDWLYGLGDYRRFALSQLITLPPDLGLEQAEALLEAVRRAHPQLSARAVAGADGHLRLVNGPGRAAPEEKPPAILAEETHEELTPSVVLAAARRAWNRLEPADGAMLVGVLLRESRSGRTLLFLAAHHAAADLVSWQIILADLAAASATRGLGGSAVIDVPREHTSMAAWSRTLARRAQGPEPARQEHYWRGVDKEVARALRLAPAAPRPPTGTRGALRSHRVRADAGSTAALLRHRTSPPEVALLAATALAEATWRAAHSTCAGAGLALVREGHGRRDELAEPYHDRRDGPVDTSRTVGWFNVLHPLVLESGGQRTTLECAEHDSLRALRLLASVREELDAVPYGGFDCPSARPAGEAAPDILFSYLGRVDRTPPANAAEERPWTVIADEALAREFPEDSEPELRQAFALELISAVHPGPDGPEFEAVWRHDPGVVATADIEELAHYWVRALTVLARAVRQQERNEK
ncbi:non-ribosomal peptide synthetase [Streptomyces sp. SM11]|uniref:non-ribosomal peptide synthetase n=1 Tax=Streptomyces sp. SM11 TaxID=565557 RepID=UPI000CD517A3|nr:non-ribosomal peptide synthetase [Streptomyces sp. SM11]